MYGCAKQEVKRGVALPIRFLASNQQNVLFGEASLHLMGTVKSTQL